MNVLVSARNAIGGADLGKFHESAEKSLWNRMKKEKNVRSVTVTMESGLMYQLQKFRKE